MPEFISGNIDRSHLLRSLRVFHVGKDQDTTRIINLIVTQIGGEQSELVIKQFGTVTDAANSIRFGERQTSAPPLVLLDKKPRGEEVSIIWGLIADGARLLFSRRAIAPELWVLKKEATRLGLPVEMAETDASLKHLFQASLEAVLLTFSDAVSEAERWRRKFASSQGKIADSETSRTEFLGSLPGVAQATAPLRAPSGRLDADKVAELFDLTRSDIAKIAGGTPEAVRKTPDSPRLQPSLQLLEQCARLLVLNPDPVNFRTWLNTPNSELGDVTPIAAIKDGRADIVAHMVEDVLTNRGG